MKFKASIGIIILLFVSGFSDNSLRFSRFIKKSNLPDDYQAFVETVNYMFIDSTFHSIKLDTIGHPSIDSLIRQTDFLSSIIYQNGFRDSVHDGGIGILLLIRNGFPIVSMPIIDAPAFRAGIIPNDTIIKIDSISTKNLSIDSVVSLLRGQKGTPTLIQTKRRNRINPPIKIIREKIVLQNIPTACVFKDSIGYVRLITFDSAIVEDLRKKCDTLISLNCKVLIIDIRNNTGGLLQSSINSAGLFLPKGTLIAKIRQLPNYGDATYKSSSANFEKLPLIVLINSLTNAGAEVFAAALKERNTTCLVGSKTSGFGSVQTVFGFKKYSLKLTTGFLFTPSNQSIEKNGIEPDSIIEEPKEFERIKFLTNCNTSDSSILDEQIIGALKIAHKMLIQ